MGQGFLIAPRTAADEQDYTYRRVLKPSGEWGFERVPVNGALPTGSPVFPKRAPEFKMGEKSFNQSSVVEHLLKRDRIYINSKDMKRESLSATLIPRLMNFLDRGFEWIIEAQPHNGAANVSLYNERLGQMFVLFFKKQEELAMWAQNQDVKPYRIRKKNVPYTDDPGSDVDVPAGADGIEMLIMGRPGKQETPFGRMVDLD